MKTWILGAPDPEMEAIERLLGECEQPVEHAASGGRRVRPGSAYQADQPTSDGGHVFVECRPASGLAEGDMAIDHHNPGDSGYGREPLEFLPASSIGQVIAALAREPGSEIYSPLGAWPRARLQAHPEAGALCFEGGAWHCAVAGMRREGTRGTFGGVYARWVSIPCELVLVAAADHCLSAAYRGECPGVDPDDLMRWRVESRAAFQGRSPDDLLRDVEYSRTELRARALEPHPDDCRRINLAGEYVADCRDEHLPELPEASAREGIGFIATPITPDGRRKVSCSGTPDQVRDFLERWAPAHGLVDLYGDPMRGFAGGYGVPET